MSSSGSPPPARTRIAFAGVTDVGRHRKHNEDCVLVRPEHGLFVVADGMGGHNAGDVASKLVAKSLGEYFDAVAQGAPDAELPADYASLSPAGKRLCAGVRKANHDVFTVSNTVQQHHGMGSTVVAIYLVDEVVNIAHVGDSRCYRIRDGEIRQMTRDHSLINDALELKPDLTKEELARLPKNIITRALGMKEAVKVDVKSEPALPGDVFLLCSDGLTGMVPPEQILEVVGLTSEPQEACELLIAEANDAGGNDNISAVIVRVDPAVPEPVLVEDHHVVIEAEEDHEELAAEELQEDNEEVVPAVPPPPSMPTLEIVDEPVSDELLGGEPPEELFTPEERAILAELEKVGLDLQGSWSDRVLVRRCRRCTYELFPGNRFCVECGARIS